MSVLSGYYRDEQRCTGWRKYYGRRSCILTKFLSMSARYKNDGDCHPVQQVPNLHPKGRA